MSSRWQSLVDTIIAEAVPALFHAYHLPVRPTDFVPDPDGKSTRAHDILAVIGFTSEAVLGTLSLSTSPQVLLRAGGIQSLLRDWTGELSNQLLGRIKNRLFHYGLVLNGSIPVVLTGRELEIYAPRLNDRRTYVYTADPGLVLVQLSSQISKDVCLESAKFPLEEPIQSEGEMTLF